MKHLKLFENFDWSDDDFDFEEDYNIYPIICADLTNDEFRNLLKVGDRINITTNKYCRIGFKRLKGPLNATVLKYDEIGEFYVFEFDEYIDGHTGGHCWNMEKSDIILNKIY